MARSKGHREHMPRRTKQVQYDLWADVKSYLPLLDSHTYSGNYAAGVIIVFIAIFLIFKLNADNKFTTKRTTQSLKPGINLSCQSFVYDHAAAQIQRKLNMEMYEFDFQTNGIDRRSKLTLQEFWDVYDAKWPIVLTNVMNDWPARKWSTQYFNDSYGEERVVMKAVNGKLNSATGLALPLGLFIKHLNDCAPTIWTYLEDELFLPRRQELYKQVPKNLYTEEDFFLLFPAEIRPWDRMLLWGTTHSRSSLHMDPYNWTGTNAVLKGHKIFKLFPPGQDDLLYIKPDGKCGFPLDCFKYNSPIDTFEPDLEKYPKYKDAQYLELDLYPGEFLIIPSGWFHQAYNLEETMAISGQFMNRNNYLIILEEILKAGNLKRERLPPYFHTLLPPDQVTYLISMLPKHVIEMGAKITELAIEQLEHVKGKDRQKLEFFRKND